MPRIAWWTPGQEPPCALRHHRERRAAPEWEGHVTLEFSDTTPPPAKIRANEGVARMLCFESDEVCETSYEAHGGKGQGQRGVTAAPTAIDSGTMSITPRSSPPRVTLAAAWLWLAATLVSTAVFGSALESAQPAAQVIAIRGKAVYGTDLDTVMRYGREQRLDAPELQLHEGQWLPEGAAVLVHPNASVMLRWRDGREQALGPSASYASLLIASPAPRAAPSKPTATRSLVDQVPTPWRDFERRHRPLLLFALGAALVLLPLLRRAPYRPGVVARVAAAVLLLGVTLPISVLLAGAQVGRISSFYFPRTPGESWTGIAAGITQGVHLLTLLLTAAGWAALWVLALSFITGGAERLGRRGWGWWTLCLAAAACASASFLGPHAPNIDFKSEWYHFWMHLGRFYAKGVWMLPLLALLFACAPRAHARWRGPTASMLMLTFLGCWWVGYRADYEPYRVVPHGTADSRAEARRAVCMAQHVFVGTVEDVRLVVEPGCTPAHLRPTGDISGLLQRCEAAALEVHVGEVLRSASLASGAVVEYRVGRVRTPFADLALTRGARYVFATVANDGSDATIHHNASRNGTRGAAELGFWRATDGAPYERGLLQDCPQVP